MAKSVKDIRTDVLIIGGGTAGCYAAKYIAEHSKLNVVVAEKAFIKRSGCLAAGVNALNAYIGPGQTADSHTDYIRSEFGSVIREDLVYTIAEKLNSVVDSLADMGLPILRNEDGSYAMRGKRSVKINGENIKPLLAAAIENHPQIEVVEGISIYDYVRVNGRIIGALGFSTITGRFYRFLAKGTIIATGGAAGIYLPNKPDSNPHKMWYSPFNTGAGYAAGIRAGAEMTTFEMRFIALRIKGTIAPTGTIAQSFNSRHINRYGEEYLEKTHRPTTVDRLKATVEEYRQGRGPCYLETVGIDEEAQQDLFRAYLNMAPAQTLKWVEADKFPKSNNVPIHGTEPYSVGGHGASGYWVDTDRRTTLPGLYAAGDVSGGSPKKYVTGCMAEAVIASETVIRDILAMDEETTFPNLQEEAAIPGQLQDDAPDLNLDRYEKELQSTMDRYAGGISTFYAYTDAGLSVAKDRVSLLLETLYSLKVPTVSALKELYEIIDRAYVARVIIAHLAARKETRWPCYQSNDTYPASSAEYEHFINSVYENGTVHTFGRPLTRRHDKYEHHHR